MKIIKKIITLIFILLLILIILNISSSIVYMSDDNNNDNKGIGLILFIISSAFALYFGFDDSYIPPKTPKKRFLSLTEEELKLILDNQDLDKQNTIEHLSSIPNSSNIPDITINNPFLFYIPFVICSVIFAFYYSNLLNFKDFIDNFILKNKIKYPRIYKYRTFIVLFLYWFVLLFIHFNTKL